MYSKQTYVSEKAIPTFLVTDEEKNAIKQMGESGNEKKKYPCSVKYLN